MAPSPTEETHTQATYTFRQCELRWRAPGARAKRAICYKFQGENAASKSNEKHCHIFMVFQNIAKTIGDRPISELAILEQTIAIVLVSKNVALVFTTVTFLKKYRKQKK